MKPECGSDRNAHNLLPEAGNASNLLRFKVVGECNVELD